MGWDNSSGNDGVGGKHTVRRRGGLMLAGPGRLRTGLTLAGILLVAAGTQVIPSLPLPPASVATVASALPTLPFEVRLDASLQRLQAGLRAGGEYTAIFQEIVAEGRQLLHLDPEANRGRGSWAELVGTIDDHTEAVGILVPGSSAFITDDNFAKYHQRAASLVEESDGRLAMVVWAAGAFPKGWLQGAVTGYQRRLGRALALFSHELQAEIDRERGRGADVRVVVAGHSFGGAVVGAAERYGLAADAVMHIASAGMGEVGDPHDYPQPHRSRYSMTAPGDLIGLVQGMPALPGLGHGPDPDRFRCVTTLPTGSLPAEPAAMDESGQPLGERAGAPLGGVSSHSEVFIPYSDAWWQIYRVFLGRVPSPDRCPPPDYEPPHLRVLPLAVPRVITDSHCRAGSGLRPADRQRLLSRLG